MDLTQTEKTQIANIMQSKYDAGLSIHHADTPYGPVCYTVESTDGGAVWSTEVLTVNRLPHVLMGTYRFGYEYDYDSGSWAANPDKPIAHVGGYPGLRRMLDSTQWANERCAPTENAARKLAQSLGQAIAPSFADPAEAKANERELAAQDWERKARNADDEAARLLEKAMDYRAQAARIRAGADYDRRAA